MFYVVFDLIIGVLYVNFVSVVFGVIVFVLLFLFGCGVCVFVMFVVIVLLIVVGYVIDW